MTAEKDTNAYPALTAETRRRWSEEARLRGGVPLPGDADPNTRYFANRIVHLLDALTAVEQERDDLAELLDEAIDREKTLEKEADRG